MLQLICVAGSRYREVLTEHAGHILGVIAYGVARPELPAQLVPCTWVPMPVFGEDVWYEFWVSARPVTVDLASGLGFAYDGKLLFGGLVMDEQATGTLESSVQSAYSTLFDTLDRVGYPALLRVWNYLPRINDDLSGIERYRAFNIGRHEAFCNKGRLIAEGVVPAACALGTHQGGVSISFLAGKVPGTVIENPRQTNAYRYPRKFGPRSPTFSRGILVDDLLLISGTASIVGSQSMHPEDILRQADETLVNLETVVEQARKSGFDASDQAGLCLNVYLRHADDYPVVRRRVEETFGNARHIAYVMADVCRADLLVEIEAFWMAS